MATLPEADDLELWSATRYTGRVLHFAWAHLEELLALNERTSASSGKDLREALEHEWLWLPSGIICTCRFDQPRTAAAGAGPSRASARTPNVLLADLLTGYQALPINSLARTRLWLQYTPTHHWLIHHGRGEGCWANYHGEALVSGELGHLVRHTETQIAEMAPRQFDACHRARLRSETYGRLATPMDSLGEPWACYAFMAAYLNLGEAAFLASGDWR